MTQIGAIQSHAGSRIAASGFGARKVEKARDSKGLRQDRRRETYGSQWFPYERRKANLSRVETTGATPLWYGPGLRAPFVAQLLGQALKAETVNLHDAAYKEHLAPALVLDRNA